MMYIGLSFPYCVKDLVNGHVAMDDVVSVAMQRPMYPDSQERALKILGQTIWSIKEKECLDMVKTLAILGKIEQIDDYDYVLEDGIWQDEQGQKGWMFQGEFYPNYSDYMDAVFLSLPG